MKDNLIASLKKRLYVLECLAGKAPKKCVKNLAHGLIYSKLCFGIQYWCSPLADHIWNQIIVIVNRAARAVLKIKPLQMHVLDMYRVLNWLPPFACKNYHELNLFWSIKKWEIPANLSKMFESGDRAFHLNEARMRTRSVSQNSIPRTQENDSRGQRSVSFVPRMVKKFNELDPEYKSLPMTANDATDLERFVMLKEKLRDKCQWDVLGYPFTWPEDRESALLDRGDEIYGLGIDSDTTTDDDTDNETA